MDSVVNYVIGFLPFLFGVLLPFTFVLRGGGIMKGFFLCWAALLVSFTVFSMIVPVVVWQITRDKGLAVWVSARFPEPPAVIAMLF